MTPNPEDPAELAPVEPPPPEREPFWGYGDLLVFLGLAEGIAIYGLIIAIMILNKL